MAQICGLTPSTKPGARGLIVPAASATGNPGENTLLPETASEIKRLGLRPRELALDGGFGHLRSDGYGLKRSRLKGHEGQQIWTGWGILAYNLDTLAV